MLGIILGLIFCAVFLTYKPLFKVLKVSKFNYQNLKTELAKDEVKKEFSDFAGKQADLLQQALIKIFCFIVSVFSKKEKGEKQEEKQSNENNKQKEQSSPESNNANEQSQTNADSSDLTKK